MPLTIIDDCITNLPVCNAACCKGVTFILNPQEIYALQPGMKIELVVPMDDDKKLYYRLHGIKTARGRARFTLKDYDIKGNELHLHRVCEWLDETNRCKEHASGKKPQLCKDFTRETAKNGRFTIPKGCIFS